MLIRLQKLEKAILREIIRSQRYGKYHKESEEIKKLYAENTHKFTGFFQTELLVTNVNF